MTTQAQASTIEELTALQKFFSNAETQLKAGNIVDMTGIDQRISNVCRAVQESAPELQQAFLPELTTLIQLLGDYERELRTLQAAFANKASGTANDDSKS